ncbi:bifunctional ADP-dependent NAD(P)H-hydrate dehydratase/NAD(P)H-hydrate epimerase [Cellulomonas sp. PhB143]|uniref:bifunctional ADP-dependent NAD(P)H-hydrate dehydratase/NAD(P)H-hydrate epimerase n=1 Tax=Cellulomonas sp. PhB143 TaxID=2485186 RepID=UPI000F49638A|nr:bifunctional ADP-dependent NAD(P)H-hydrate dehydratase/NAD(P)H-hydrate epimerase [Cellulomonas sp. PhB143]ROS76821.1 NAD(P)H-hydrate repair Nnr-like enzyme with NAD(P)H-hydrate dehydratase domain [Cellulomonas sp. PhB143]
MIEAWSAEDVRAAEVPLLESGVPLMQMAAFMLATTSTPALLPTGSGEELDALPGVRVALLVGSGANGGDALHAGAVLASREADVVAACISERVHPEGLEALREAGGRVVDLSAGPTSPDWSSTIADVLACDLVFDGLVGIGATGPLRGVALELVRSLTGADELARTLEVARTSTSTGPGRARKGTAIATLGGGPRTGRTERPRPVVVAVDAPSGIGVDDGTVGGPVLPADVTLTFGATKPGLLLPPAAHLAGDVHFVDLGLSQPIAEQGAEPVLRRLELGDVADLWPVPGPTDDKYSRGVLGVVAGTPTYPGAAVLVTTAAVRTGAGMVRYVGPDAVAASVLAARPEVVPAEGRVQAWTVGPGLPGEGAGDDAGQLARAREALDAAAGDPDQDRAPVPVVVDAGALDLVATRVQDGGRLSAHVVLTPHAGELSRLLRALGERAGRDEVEAEPLRHARRAHELTGATVLLKGGVTVVVGPGVVYSQADASGWVATAGSGDVLSGILGTLLAAYPQECVDEPDLAARLAAAASLVHGVAGGAANPGGPVSALDVARAVPAVVAELLRDDEDE